MNGKVTILLLITALNLGTISEVVGFLEAPLDLARLSAESDVICSGRVLETRSDAEGAVLSFKIERVLKGSVRAGSTIDIHCAEPVSSGISTKTNPCQNTSGWALLLLRFEAGKCLFARSMISSMPVAERARTPYIQSADVTANLHWELVNSLQDSSPTVIKAALGQIEMFSRTKPLPLSLVGAHLTRLAQHADPNIRAMAIAGSLASGDASSVLVALDFLASMTDGKDYGSKAEFVRVRLALEQFLVPPDYVGVLAKSLDSECQELREIASFALRNMRHLAAVPYLKSVLDDSSDKVRYNGVMGLAAVAGDSAHTPAYELFLSDEERYIEHWKKWEPPVDASSVATQFARASSLTAAKNSFDYSSEGLRSREVVKQEYGENPLEAIRAAILDRGLDYKAWRRAVAAAAFLGEAGVEELLTHLKPSLARREYGLRTEALLDSAGRIVDRRVLELTVDILESKDTSVGMRQLKLQASGIAKKQVEGASWSASKPIASDHTGKVISTAACGSISIRCGDSYSFGLSADRECVLAVRARLAALVDGLKKQDPTLAEKVSEVIAAIDRKEEIIRKCLESEVTSGTG